MTDNEKMLWAVAYVDGDGFQGPLHRAQYATEVIDRARSSLDEYMQSVEGRQNPADYILDLQEMVGEDQGDSVAVSCEECVDTAVEIIQEMLGDLNTEVKDV